MSTPTPVALTTVQQVVLTASETNAEGGAVTPADTLTWQVDNSSVVTLQPSDLTCLAVAAGVGTANVTVTDPGANLTSAALQIVVTAAAATAIAISAGAPEDQVAPAAG